MGDNIAQALQPLAGSPSSLKLAPREVMRLDQSALSIGMDFFPLQGS